MMDHDIGPAIPAAPAPHDPGGKKRFPLQPGVRGNVMFLGDGSCYRPWLERVWGHLFQHFASRSPWQPIDTLPDHIPEADDMILVATADGRRMIWRIDILKNQLRRLAEGRQPGHLQFPATLWARLPKLPESA